MMSNLNSVLLEGELTTDPELEYDDKGSAVTRYQLESTRYYKQGSEIPKAQKTTVLVVTRARQAEVNAEYLEKGRCVRVVGRLALNGQLYIEAEHVEFKPKYTK